MTLLHKQVLALSWLIVIAELCAIAYFHQDVVNWLSHHLWLVVLPFVKIVFKRMAALKFVALLKNLVVVVWHLLKLLLLKLLKTIGVRYGLFFSQNRWYWMRRTKVMFVRRGKQFFRQLKNFWQEYLRHQRVVLVVAFFPVVIVLSLLGLSFNITRKTMVKKAQEGAIFKAASSASNTSHGIRAWLARIDRAVLQKIQGLSVEAESLTQKKLNSDR